MRAPPYQPPLLCCPLGNSSVAASAILQNPQCLILTGEKQQPLQGKCSRWASSLCCLPSSQVRAGSDESSSSPAGLSPTPRGPGLEWQAAFRLKLVMLLWALAVKGSYRQILRLEAPALGFKHQWSRGSYCNPQSPPASIIYTPNEPQHWEP